MDKSKPSSQNKTPNMHDYQTLEYQNFSLQKKLELRKKEIEFLQKQIRTFLAKNMQWTSL